MKDEIKEILDKLKNIEDYLSFSEAKQIEDYITNLDEKYKKSCETYQQALDETMSEKMDLQEELDRCVKTNIILDNENTELANNYVLTEYVDEMTKLKDENKKLKENKEKAIKFIKNKQELNKMFGTITLSKDSQNELLNILGGDDND